MKKTLFTALFCLTVSTVFAQTSFTISGRKIDIKGKSAGKFMLSTDYKASYEDFFEVVAQKNLVINNVQTFLDEKGENKDLVTYMLNLADIKTDFFEDRFINEDTKEHRMFREDSYEIVLFPKDGKSFKSVSWGRSDKAGDTPELTDQNQARIVFRNLTEAKDFIKLMQKLTK